MRTKRKTGNKRNKTVRGFVEGQQEEGHKDIIQRS
jgi:hypothetical protein